MMSLREIVTELEGCAAWEAIGINQLETTRFEPELDVVAQQTIRTAKRRAQALGEAASLLAHLARLPASGARPEPGHAGA